MDLAVLLYHLDKSSGSNKETFYALKVDSFTITIAKTPIQIPIPQNSPQLVDFGIFRPAITLSAIVDNGPANDSTTSTGSGATLVGYQGMESVVSGGTTYYIPYKNKLEDAIYQWVADNDNVLTLSVGDDTYPIYDIDSDGDAVSGSNPQATGGASYVVALQQARFQLDAGREDRWIVQMQFVCEARKDTKGRFFSA
tara:strand:- start:20 stop:610 length:591 start_codon:yes stop_codon:yes gene_type:complete